MARATRQQRSKASGDSGKPRCNISTRAISDAQERYIQTIRSRTITFGIGPAGTGKTFVAISLAAQALANREIDRLIVARPVADAGGTLGFLPGTLADKYEPYVRPVRDVLDVVMGSGPTTYALKAGQIQAIPLELMRGLSFDNCWIVLDEAQNSTPKQMKMLLTRIGRGSKVIVNGDMDQSDLPSHVLSGLDDAVNRFEPYVDSHPEIGIVRFGHEDIVRSGIVRTVLEAYRA